VGAIVCVVATVLGGVVSAREVVEPGDPVPGVSNRRHPDQGADGFVVEDPVPDRPHEDYVGPPAPRNVPLVTGPAGRWSRGRFTSVQVNIDADGNNIVGDAANEPSLVVDPNDPNVMAIGWRQFDTVDSSFRQAGVAYSRDGGQTWTNPGPLDPGVFRTDPVLRSDRTGRFYYSSLSGQALDSVEVFHSTDGGQTWSQPVPAFGGDKQWITVDPTAGVGDGHVYQIWNVQFSCCPPNDLTRSIDRGITFQPPLDVPDPKMKWGTMDVDASGRLFLGGTTLNQASHVIARSDNARDPGQTPVFNFVNGVNLGGSTRGFAGSSSPNPRGLLGQVWLVVDRTDTATRDNVYMLSSVNPPDNDPLDIYVIRSTDGGATFSAPVRVNDDPVGSNAWQWFGTLSVAPSGRLDVIWNDTRGSGNPRLSELYYAWSTDAGRTWSANVPISPTFDSHLGFPQQDKLGDYYDMVSDGVGAAIAYAATFNGEQDIYFLRLTVDCNGNGIHDGDDIASGFSRDDDGDGIPDECQACTGRERIRKARCRARTGGNRLAVKLVRGQPGDAFEVELDDGTSRTGNLDDAGKAKVRFRDVASGAGTVTARWSCGSEATANYDCP